jgi:pimeloyl-ACP methyl ester carboxylesterase
MPKIAVNGTQVSYTRSGSGEPMILLHSSASSKEQWDAIRHRLPDRYEVLAVDLYGYGETGGWQRSDEPTLADEAALVAALMERCGEPVHLVGHSYGGAVALRVALERPHRLRSLTLIEPVAFHLLRDAGPVEAELFREIADIAAGVSRSAADRGYDDGMAQFIDFWNGADTWARVRPEIRVTLGRHAATVAKDFRATMNEPSLPAAYGWIDTPTQILCGARSPLVAYAIADRLDSVLPNAQLDIVDEAGHMMPMSHPEAVAAAITRHLDAQLPVGELAA